jgi:hypothetical protein
MNNIYSTSWQFCTNYEVVVFHMRGKIQIEGTSEQDAEGIIWA